MEEAYYVSLLSRKLIIGNTAEHLCLSDRGKEARHASLLLLVVSCLSSTVPVQVRTVSAKALGAMVKGMGESCFEDLLPWLMETLTYEQSSVDRSGAAQGKAEVGPGARP